MAMACMQVLIWAADAPRMPRGSASSLSFHARAHPPPPSLQSPSPPSPFPLPPPPSPPFPLPPPLSHLPRPPPPGSRARREDSPMHPRLGCAPLGRPHDRPGRSLGWRGHSLGTARDARLPRGRCPCMQMLITAPSLLPTGTGRNACVACGALDPQRHWRRAALGRQPTRELRPCHRARARHGARLGWATWAVAHHGAALDGATPPTTEACEY